MENAKIIFSSKKHCFFAGKYERKIPEKIPEFPLGKSVISIHDINFKMFH